MSGMQKQFETAKIIRNGKGFDMYRRLCRSIRNIMLSGVCGGIGEYFGIDPSVVRVLWVILSVASVGAGILAYIACALILPKAIP